MPSFMAVVMEENPPWVAKSFVLLNTVFWALQNAVVIELPVTPEIVDIELGMTLPF